MLYDCKLNGRLSSNVDGYVDNYLLMLCSMPLTIIVRLVFNIKNPAMNNMFINTLSSSLSCLLPHRCIHTHIVFILCYVIGHFASIIANTSKEPVCPRVELILKIIIVLLIIFLGFIKSKPC